MSCAPEGSGWQLQRQRRLLSVTCRKDFKRTTSNLSVIEFCSTISAQHPHNLLRNKRDINLVASSANFFFSHRLCTDVFNLMCSTNIFSQQLEHSRDSG
ncbi:hypothetical protein B566_EDAN013992 [Ephemera danica]|nr:hypothetical protein B566_EDAN013992 [Ephemera danica]